MYFYYCPVDLLRYLAHHEINCGQKKSKLSPGFQFINILKQRGGNSPNFFRAYGEVGWKYPSLFHTFKKF
jgi:hypothetical protein